MSLSKYFAEFVATFALTFGVSVSLVNPDFPIPTPFVAAFTVGIMVYCIGKISMAQINPAVTLALAAAQKIRMGEVIPYIASQILGALLAMVMIGWLFPEGGVALEAGDGMMLFVGEALGAFFLMFGISSAVTGVTHEASAGIVIGGSLLIGIGMALSFSNAILNPAVAIGLGSVSASYMIAPCVGTLLGLGAYWWIKPQKA